MLGTGGVGLFLFNRGYQPMFRVRRHCHNARYRDRAYRNRANASHSMNYATSNHSPIGYTNSMDMKANEKIYSTIIGGCATLGTGVGFFLFNISVFAFVGSIMLGTGVGLIVTALMRLSLKRNKQP